MSRDDQPRVVHTEGFGKRILNQRGANLQRETPTYVLDGMDFKSPMMIREGRSAKASPGLRLNRGGPRTRSSNHRRFAPTTSTLARSATFNPIRRLLA